MKQNKSDINEKFTPANADEIVSCPLCNSVNYKVITTGSDYEYHLPGIFYISRCRKCGLYFQNPRPVFSEIMRYYTKQYAPYKKMGSPLMQWIRYIVLIRPKISELKKLIGNNAKVLDVGCSTGDLLIELKKKTEWELEGIEPKHETAQIAINRGLKIHTTTLEKANLKPDSYDLIIMNHVLEHTPNPTEITSVVFELLKNGGYFYGVLPSSDCIERNVFGRYWQGYHLPRHLTWFSKRQLKEFLERFGFTKVECSSQPHASNWQVSLKNFLYTHNFPDVCINIFNGHNIILYFITAPFTILLSRIGQGPIQKFIAKKPDLEVNLK